MTSGISQSSDNTLTGTPPRGRVSSGISHMHTKLTDRTVQLHALLYIGSVVSGLCSLCELHPTSRVSGPRPPPYTALPRQMRKAPAWPVQRFRLVGPHEQVQTQRDLLPAHCSTTLSSETRFFLILLMLLKNSGGTLIHRKN